MGLDHERGERLGAWAFWTGIALTLAGGTYWAYRRGRRRTALFEGRDLGRPIDQRKSAGMTLTHHRSRMPIKERVGILQDLTWESVKDPKMRKLALEVTRRCPERDGACEAKAIFNAVKRRIRYTGDVAPVKMGRNGPVEGVDLFQSAYRTWEFGGGDCDDHSVLVCTLATLNGLPCKYRVTAPGRGREQDWQHIYPMVGLPKEKPRKWIALDTTLPGNRFNYEAPYGKKIDFPA